MQFFADLCQLGEFPTNLYRGKHICEFCEPPRDIIAQDQFYYFVWSSTREGNGDIRVAGPDGVTFIAPVLITHYIAEHQYRPPQEFIDSVLRLHGHSPEAA